MLGAKENHIIYSIPSDYMDILVSSFLDKDNMVLKGGITLLGTRIGYGKTSTANSMMHNIETSPDLGWVQIAYLHSVEMRLSEISFVEKAKQLMSEHKASKLLVVIDSINTLDAMKAAILLGNAGYSVFGLVEVGIHRGVSTVLEGAVSHSRGYERIIAANQLLKELDLIIFQEDNCPMTCTYLALDKSKSGILADMLNNHGMDYMLKEVIDKQDGVAHKECDFLHLGEQSVV